MTAVIVALGLCLALNASAQTVRYVSPAGSDTNPGTEAAPYQTIQKAANVVNPGDTVLVEDGTYTRVVTAACGTQTRPVLCLSRGGTSAAWVTFKSRNVGGAKLDGQANASTDGVRFLANANFITLQDFEIFDVANVAGSASGVELYNGGHDVRIINNHIHHIGNVCTDTSNGQVGIYVQQDRVSLLNNTIHDIGRFLNGENGCVTTYQASRDHGIYLNGNASGGLSEIEIRDSLFSNTARGWAIQLYPGSIDRLTIANNGFSGTNPIQPGHIIIGARLSNVSIANNLFDHPKTAALDFYQGKYTNVSVTDNVVSGAALATGRDRGVIYSGNVVQ